MPSADFDDCLSGMRLIQDFVTVDELNIRFSIEVTPYIHPFIIPLFEKQGWVVNGSRISFARGKDPCEC